MSTVANPYNWRKAPSQYASGFFDIEHQHVQQAISGAQADLGWFNVLDGGTRVGQGNDDSAAFLATLAALPSAGGKIRVPPAPSGQYTIAQKLPIPADITSRTIEIVGEGEAILHNVAPANNPTLQLLGTDSSHVARGLKVRDLIFTGEAAYPNHGYHTRFSIESEVSSCIFCCHGSGIYTDGGVYGHVWDKNQIWPTGRSHGAPTVPSQYSGILFDTPVAGGNYANAMRIRDLICEAGGNGIDLKAGYAQPQGWLIDGRNVCEGLRGIPSGGRWGASLVGLMRSTLIGLYTELNSLTAVLGDVTDSHLNLDTCSFLTVMGTTGTGKMQLRNCNQVTLINNTMNNFDCDNTNVGVNIFGMNVAVAGGAGVGYTNNASERVECGVYGAGGLTQQMRLWNGMMISRDALGPTVGFYGSAGTVKGAVTGSRGGNAALASLLTYLAGLGILTDSTSV